MFEGDRWQDLQAKAQSPAVAASATIEAIRRVVAALEANEKSAKTLGTRIWWLNVVLLAVTVAIAAMTLVQAAAAWRTLMQ